MHALFHIRTAIIGMMIAVLIWKRACINLLVKTFVSLFSLLIKHNEKIIVIIFTENICCASELPKYVGYGHQINLSFLFIAIPPPPKKTGDGMLYGWYHMILTHQQPTKQMYSFINCYTIIFLHFCFIKFDNIQLMTFHFGGHCDLSTPRKCCSPKPTSEVNIASKGVDKSVSTEMKSHQLFY